MLIVSQNLTNYNAIEIPKDTILRVNLAWCDSLKDFKLILKKHHDEQIFVDLPVRRVKPPNNKYDIGDLIPILKSHKQIIYFAISNVETSADLIQYIKLLPKHITIIPKIESTTAIKNIKVIMKSLKNREKILMLDHDDLFSDLLKRNESPSQFKKYIKKLVAFCKNNDVKLLRTVGVIFNDEEMRVSQYIK